MSSVITFQAESRSSLASSFSNNNIIEESFLDESQLESILQENMKLIKLQQYQNFLKLDQQFNNNANISAINTLQDLEVNDLIANVENYINLCLQSISKTDNLIDVAFNTENIVINKTRKKMSNGQLQDELSEYECELSKNDYAVVVDTMIKLDLLRNGLRSGPLPIQKPPQTQPSNLDRDPTQDLFNLPKLLRQDNTSISSQQSFYKQNAIKTSVLFKYFLVLELNSQYFEFSRINKKEPVYSIKMVKRPPKWSNNDYEQICVDVTINKKEEPIEKIISNILNKNITDKVYTHPPPQPVKDSHKFKTVRYLNSKALYDRFLRHFDKVLKCEWPAKSNTKTAESVNNHSNHPTNGHSGSNSQNEPGKVLDEGKTCEIKDNKLRITFKWKGPKQKNLDVTITINLAIKFNDKLIESQIFDSKLLIFNRFLQNGGFFTKIPLIDETKMNFITSWMQKHLKLNLNSIYLIPNFVHYWSLNFQPLKLNIIRFFCWLNNLRKNIDGGDMMVEILSGREYQEKGSSDLLRGLFTNAIYQKNFVAKTCLNFTMLLLNNYNSNLMFTFKMLQFFNHVCFTATDLSPRLKNINQCEDELIVEILLLEMLNTNETSLVDENNNNNKLPEDLCWSQDNIFDRYWSCLMRFRESFINSQMSDPFNVLDNVLPNVFITSVGGESVERTSVSLIPKIDTANKSDTRKMQDFAFKPVNINEIKRILEAAMRIVFTNIVTDEKDILNQSVQVQQTNNATNATLMVPQQQTHHAQQNSLLQRRQSVSSNDLARLKSSQLTHRDSIVHK